jgi:hypothetical protein
MGYSILWAIRVHAVPAALHLADEVLEVIGGEGLIRELELGQTLGW